MGAGVNLFLSVVLTGDLPTFCPGEEADVLCFFPFCFARRAPGACAQKSRGLQTPAYQFRSATAYQQKRQRYPAHWRGQLVSRQR